MKDRTSHSYRADTPGSNPDMYQIGGQLREAFKQERCSPYIAKQMQTAAQGDDGHIPTKAQFKTKRRAPTRARSRAPSR